jgi:glucose/arabinose dehydrogenase
VAAQSPRTIIAVLALATITTLAGCYSMRGSAGGGQVRFAGTREVRAADVALPQGYVIEPVAAGLTYPTGIAFDDYNQLYVIESGYAYGESWTTPRLLRVDASGQTTAIASGTNGPWNGVTFAEGAFYVAEGGERDGGRILRITKDGKITSLISGLPSMGDHHTDGPVMGPDGWLYFGQGTATNSAVVGEDNASFGWLARHPDFHDIPCRDVVLMGHNFKTPDVRTPGSKQQVETGAYMPFGTPSSAGQVIKGKIPCSGSVMRIRPSGGKPELVAWGFRNPFGLAFSPEGHLYVTDNSYDVRGSRPVFGTGDLMWEVVPERWYGWPDFHGDARLDQDKDHFKPPGKSAPGRVLAQYPDAPPAPAAWLDVHSSSDGLDFSHNEAFGYVGQAFVAQFGDQAPVTGKVLAPVGFKVVRVNVTNGVVEEFAVNRGKHNGPASRIGTRGLERPVAVRFDPSGRSLYIVDFGVMNEDSKGSVPRPGTGVLWRVSRAPIASR